MAEDIDIIGMEFTVKSTSMTDGGIKLVEDEWLPAILTKFVPFEGNFNGIPTKQIRWMFELQGQPYSWKNKDTGAVGQFKVSGSTSYACSPKSKLYKWYCKLTGRESLPEGEKIKLGSLVNFPCYVMVKINKRKNKEGEDEVYNNVDKVKPRVVESSESKPVTTTAPSTNSSKATPNAPAAPTQAPVQPPQEQKAAGKEEDIFNDVF